MLISFLKKDATELDFIKKVLYKCELPFDLTMGLTELYKRVGLKHLNKLYESHERLSLNRKEAIESLLVTEAPNYRVNYEIKIPYLEDLSNCISINPDLENFNDLLILKFALVVYNTENFETTVDDLIHADSLHAIEFIAERHSIFDNLQNYVNFEGTSDNVHYFNTFQDLEKLILKTIILDPKKEKSYCACYTEQKVKVSVDWANAPFDTSNDDYVDAASYKQYFSKPEGPVTSAFAEYPAKAYSQARQAGKTVTQAAHHEYQNKAFEVPKGAMSIDEWKQKNKDKFDGATVSSVIVAYQAYANAFKDNPVGHSEDPRKEEDDNDDYDPNDIPF